MCGFDNRHLRSNCQSSLPVTNLSLWRYVHTGQGFFPHRLSKRTEIYKRRHFCKHVYCTKNHRQGVKYKNFSIHRSIQKPLLLHVNEMKITLKCIHVSPRTTGQAKIVNCSQIPGHIADQNWKAFMRFYFDSFKRELTIQWYFKSQVFYR